MISTILLMDFLYFIFIGVFAVSTAILIYYYLYFFNRFNKYNEIPAEYGNTTTPVSIIICARNERKNLEQFLPRVLSLNYPNYEVILMNDCSWDGSKDLLEEMEKQYPHLKAHHLEEGHLYQHDKKFPLTLGIKAALNEIVILTDADCYPKNEFWIQELLAGYNSSSKEIVIGYGAYEKQNGLLNKLIRFDTFSIALLYFSSILKGHTYMGTGRNLSYKRSLFFRNKGFATHNHIHSGDDDLFINRVATPNNVAIRINTNAHTVSNPKQNWLDWVNQKRRHVSTATYYRTRDKFYISCFYFFQLFFYVAFIGSIVTNLQTYYIPFIIFAIKAFVQVLIYKKALHKLDEKDLLVWLPFYEIFLLLFYLATHIANLFSKDQPRWK